MSGDGKGREKRNEGRERREKGKSGRRKGCEEPALQIRNRSCAPAFCGTDTVFV